MTPLVLDSPQPLFLLCMLISGLLSQRSTNIYHPGSTESFALVTHQVVVDWFLSGLVVGLLHFRLLQRMCYVQCTDVESAVLVVTVAVIKRRARVSHIFAAAVVVVLAGAVGARVAIGGALSESTCKGG